MYLKWKVAGLSQRKAAVMSKLKRYSVSASVSAGAAATVYAESAKAAVEKAQAGLDVCAGNCSRWDDTKDSVELCHCGNDYTIDDRHWYAHAEDGDEEYEEENAPDALADAKATCVCPWCEAENQKMNGNAMICCECENVSVSLGGSTPQPYMSQVEFVEVNKALVQTRETIRELSESAELRKRLSEKYDIPMPGDVYDELEKARATIERQRKALKMTSENMVQLDGHNGYWFCEECGCISNSVEKNIKHEDGCWVDRALTLAGGES